MAERYGSALGAARCGSCRELEELHRRRADPVRARAPVAWTERGEARRKAKRCPRKYDRRAPSGQKKHKLINDLATAANGP